MRTTVAGEHEEGRQRSLAAWIERLRLPVLGRRGVERERADISHVYRRAARQDLTTRNPVIVIPGVLGSRLVASVESREVWGDFRSQRTTDRTREGGVGIGLPLKMGVPLDQLHSASQTAGTLDEIKGKFAGIPIRKRVYGSVLAAMGVSGYADGAIDRGEDMPDYGDDGPATAFEFDYDWRRSLDESAIRFHRFLRDTIRFLKAQRRSDKAIRFDVVAHSMGGLLLRYFLQYGGQLLPYGDLPRPTWEGAQYVETAVFVGTPNAGSVSTLERLVSGLDSNPVHPAYAPALIGTMPALYQLMPRSRHAPLRIVGENDSPDLFDLGLWTRMGWGLAAPDGARGIAMLLPEVDSPAERRDIALEHLSKCLEAARALHRALDTVPVERPQQLFMHLIAGDSLLTPLRVAAGPGERRLRLERHAPGDGSVLRTSALLDERVGAGWVPRVRSPIKWDSVMFVPGDHLDITHQPVTINNILYLLLEKPRA